MREESFNVKSRSDHPEKTALITGANGGIGFQCARSILQAGGWRVIIAGRPGAKTDEAVQRLRREEPENGRVSAMPVDFASLASVRELAERVASLDGPPLHALVCNAGTQSFRGLVRSRDGFEITFAVNHLAHFLLAQLLLPSFQEPGRIVLVASGTHDPDTIDGRFNKPVYRSAESLAFPEKFGLEQLSGIRRYSTSKLCNILHAYELSRRLRAAGSKIDVNAYDPGATPGTGLTRDYPLALRLLFSRPVLKVLGVRNYSVAETGTAMARLVIDPTLEGTSGKYFHVHDEVRSSKDSYDEAKALDLWKTSLALTALHQGDGVFAVATDATGAMSTAKTTGEVR